MGLIGVDLGAGWGGDCCAFAAETPRSWLVELLEPPEPVPSPPKGLGPLEELTIVALAGLCSCKWTGRLTLVIYSVGLDLSL